MQIRHARQRRTILTAEAGQRAVCAGADFCLDSLFTLMEHARRLGIPAGSEAALHSPPASPWRTPTSRASMASYATGASRVSAVATTLRHTVQPDQPPQLLV